MSVAFYVLVACVCASVGAAVALVGLGLGADRRRRLARAPSPPVDEPGAVDEPFTVGNAGAFELPTAEQPRLN
jgi:hypothetical protein